MKPLLLKPIPDVTIWGSHHISHHRGISQDIGTWWEVSAHPYGSNRVRNIDTESNLLQLIQADEEGMLGKGYTLHDMLRLAYLDTKEPLSIQVHPDDAYAQLHSKDDGKYESWYILDAKEGATLVAGTRTEDTKKIQEALKQKHLEPYLQTWNVKKGDFIVIPSGMLHALGKDILALEIGTNSNTTYRFYDYNRCDANGNPRTLHLKEGFDVVDFSKQPTFVQAKKQSRIIGDTPTFTVEEYYLNEDMAISTKQHYFIISNIGEDVEVLWEEETILLPKYDSMFVPCSAKSITIRKEAHILVSQPKNKEE